MATQRQELTAAFQAQIAVQRQELTAAFQAQLQGVVGGAGPAPAQVLHVPRDHTTLQAAVDAAQAGERVVLAAGVYNGRVRINNKQVEIVGVAQGGRVVLEYEGDSSVVAVTGAAATATLSNLTIRPRGGVTDGSKYGAIFALGGSTVQVEGCDLSSEGGGGVYAQDEGTDLRLKDCTMHNCKSNGVMISRKAKATVEGCTSRDNRMAGITVLDGASATLRGNTCTGNQQHGIGIIEVEGADPTSAVVENNQLTGNTLQGLSISDRCHARVQQAHNNV
jgi:parallel beta-helix repeat protein